MIECPIPFSDYPVVTLAHGGGGSIMRRLIRNMFAATFGQANVQTSLDAALLEIPSHRIAFTTDSFVVKPLFFPGGDIGSLAVNGTVNDLAMSGAQAKYLSCSMILEEGFPMPKLWQVVQSIKQAADAAGVRIVTGDTKVVDKGKGDGIFINTAGIGVFNHEMAIGPASIQPGDAIIVNGDIGRHGMAILAAREELALEASIESDCAPLNHVVEELLEKKITIHAMRDATRGGLAAAVIELASDSGWNASLDQAAIPACEPVRGACELLGIDPLFVANEGRFVSFVPAHDASRAIQIIKMHFPATSPAVIGRVEKTKGGQVSLNSIIGAPRRLDLLSGEQLPRIC